MIVKQFRRRAMLARGPAASHLRAFSLIEAVIGMLIVSILTLSIYAALTTGFNTVRLAREDQRATQVLIQIMDQLRTVSWNSLTNGTSLPTQTLESFDPEKVIKLGKGVVNANTNALISKGYYTILTVNNATNDTTYSSNMREVNVSVTWRSLSGMRRSRDFTTYVARYGIHNYAN
jgi:uncharacterized protein (TIGR02598 family)